MVLRLTAFPIPFTFNDVIKTFVISGSDLKVREEDKSTKEGGGTSQGSRRNGERRSVRPAQMRPKPQVILQIVRKYSKAPTMGNNNEIKHSECVGKL